MLDYLELAERKRDWKMSSDISWDEIDSSLNSERKAVCIETYCVEEMYLPDYTSHGATLAREVFGAAWFQTRWSFEESRHALAFREYLIRSGMRSQSQFEALESAVFRHAWTPPFSTMRQMVCYGALQEGVTYLAYRAQTERAEQAGDDALKSIFTHLARDEAAHAGFYRKAIEIEMEADREATVADFAHVLANFKMPGDGLIACYRERLETGGGGISPRRFMEGVVLPTLKSVAITRDQLKSAHCRPR